MKKVIIVLLLLQIFTITKSQSKDFLVHTFIKRTQLNSNFPGFAVSLVSDTSVLFLNTYGYRDKEFKMRYTRETIQNIGSVSKTFIGIAIMKVVEMGLVGLDTDLNLILPFSVDNPYYPDEKLTLRHLATHTSGIKDRQAVYNKSYVPGLETNMSMEEYLLEYLSKDGLWYKKSNFNKEIPGSYYEYSNIGATLAAFVVEYVSQVPFDEFTREYIFKPSKMITSGWSYADIDMENHIMAYDNKGNPLPDYSLITYPDGGLRTTIVDLSFYLMTVIRGYHQESNILEDSSWVELFRPQFKGREVKNTDPAEPDQGIFWVHRKGGIIGHTGSDPGISVIMFFNPETRIGKIFMTNIELNKDNVEDFKKIWTKVDVLAN